MEYFNIITKILNEHKDIDASIYDDGDNENKQVLIISTTKDANLLNELLKAELYDMVDEIERRDYDSFYLDYATEDNWHFWDTSFECSECYKVYQRLEYNACSYANYYCGDGYILCENCVKENPDDYINSLVNEPTRVNTIFDYGELLKLNFEKVNTDPYANGWYNRVDNPTKIMAKARAEKPKSEFIFSIRKTYNPWECEFDLYEREVG